MSRLPYIGSPNESWQDLVAWDEELYDPFFQGETNYTSAQERNYVAGNQLSESYTSEPTYLVSAPPSIADEPPSLEYTVSAPPSILDGQSSFEQIHNTSLSFDTISTSPLVVQADSHYFGSFGACDNSLLSPLGTVSDSPILDTRYERIPEPFRECDRNRLQPPCPILLPLVQWSRNEALPSVLERRHMGRAATDHRAYCRR
jgi:hypothetical protein